MKRRGFLSVVSSLLLWPFVACLSKYKAPSNRSCRGDDKPIFPKCEELPLSVLGDVPYEGLNMPLFSDKRGAFHFCLLFPFSTLEDIKTWLTTCRRETFFAHKLYRRTNPHLSPYVLEGLWGPSDLLGTKDA